MANFDRLVDVAIRKAIEEGKFDNLRGAGQPLKLDDNPYIDPNWKTAYDILSKEDFALPWMDKRNAIEAELEALQAGLKRSWAWRERELGNGRDTDWVAAEWSRAVREFTARITALNVRIDGYNLEVPSTIFQRMRVDAERLVSSVQSA